MDDEFDFEKEFADHVTEISKSGKLDLRGFKLKCTCFAAPVQYEFFDKDGNQVGYFRYRHEGLTVRSPNHRGTLLMRYELHTNPHKIPFFDTDLLNLAALHIEAFLKGKKP